MLLQYVQIIFHPHDAIYFVKCTSSSCSKAPPQHDAATPHASWLGWCSSACKPPSFSSKHNDGHYGQTSSIFVSLDQKTFLQKVRSLSPCAVGNRSLIFFYGGFEAVVSSLLSGLSGYVSIGLVYCRYRYFCTCFLQNIHKVLCISFLSGMKAAWSHGVNTCVLFFVQMNVVPSGSWKLLPRMDQTCGCLQLYFWDLGWFLLIIPWCQAKRHWVWR